MGFEELTVVCVLGLVKTNHNQSSPSSAQLLVLLTFSSADKETSDSVGELLPVASGKGVLLEIQSVCIHRDWLRRTLPVHLSVKYKSLAEFRLLKPDTRHISTNPGRTAHELFSWPAISGSSLCVSDFLTLRFFIPRVSQFTQVDSVDTSDKFKEQDRFGSVR